MPYMMLRYFHMKIIQEHEAKEVRENLFLSSLLDYTSQNIMKSFAALCSAGRVPNQWFN